MNPDRKRKIGRLLHLGWSYARISEHLGISLQTLKDQIVREGMTHYDRPDFLPLPVLAAELGITHASLYERVQRGQLEPVRHGKLIGFTRREADKAKALVNEVKEAQPGWWTTEEAARRTGYTRNGFHDAARRNGLQGVKVRTRSKSVALMWNPVEVLSICRKRRAA